VRDKVAADLYREAGVPTPRVAFYRVFVDTGQGSTYFGLYTVAEMPDHPFIDTQLGGGDGNLYKADGPGARLMAFDAASFEKKTNKGANDFSDVMTFIGALAAPRGDAATWRATLERSFDVERFLRWLPMTALLANWDVYGAYPHNYYLYGVPERGGQLRWIQWDSNEAFKKDARAIHLDLTGLPPGWPLLNHVSADPMYRATYRRTLATLLDTVFVPDRVKARLQAEHDLITPYVVGGEGEIPGYSLLSSPRAFASELTAVLSLVDDQSRAAREALAAQ
jgi:hypothetical protein